MIERAYRYLEAPCPVPSKVNVNWSRLGVPTEKPFTLSITVGKEHMANTIEHVPNTTVVHWIEHMATEHSASLGLDENWYRQRNLIWFVRRHEIDYLGELLEGDTLAMATWIESFSKVSSPRRYLIVRASDEAILIRATTIWVLVDRTSRRPKRIDPELFKRYMI